MIRWLPVWIVRGLCVVAVILVIGLSLTLFLVTEPLFTAPPARNPGRADPKRLEAHVRVLADELAPRDWSHPENLDRAASYIERQFELAHGRVREQRYEWQGRTYRNVVSSFGPDTRDVIVVGAHYDAFGEFPGADDNASGVAGLLELARMLDSKTPASRVDLVAFTLEEPTAAEGPGLFRSPVGGSAVHAASLATQDFHVRLVVNLEMIGFFTESDDSQRYPIGLLSLFYPTRGDFLAVVGTFGQGRAMRLVKGAMRSASPLPVYSLSAPAFVQGVDWSDHANYWARGYDAVMVTDTALYRNSSYHTSGDTPETLDYTRMAHVVNGVLAAVQAAADR